MTEAKDKILELLQEAVGEKNASNDPAVCIGYSRDQFVRTRGPDYVVLVRNRDEIASVLRIAHEHEIPIIPKGTGANISGAVIPEKGGIILDLKLMNRILELDPFNMTAVIEPGVTFGMLQIEAWKHGLFTPEPSGPHTVKVISNFVACRGISTYSAKYGLGDQHVLGYEWVLPNGEILKMGCFAHPAGEDSENWEHSPGPDISGIFLEAFGTLGVCTKAKIKLYPKMEAREGGAPDGYVYILGPLEDCFKLLNSLVKYGVYSNAFMTRWPYISMIFGPTKVRSQEMMKTPAFEALLTIVLEGTPRRIEFNTKRLKKI
ncbi:MAG: FAD-binding oxidoreductase, partial [Candidatus Helarchaeota archaeon]